MKLIFKILKKIFKRRGIIFIGVQIIKNTYIITTESKDDSIEIKS